jgi:hypothetical protein
MQARSPPPNRAADIGLLDEWHGAHCSIRSDTGFELLAERFCAGGERQPGMIGRETMAAYRPACLPGAAVRKFFP